ncbi:MAG TPA: hypothetical protein VKG92_12190, partial [Flavobacteriales bacterium]|nr:hypothetical protein [Flavobacteriales bacterium]
AGEYFFWRITDTSGRLIEEGTSTSTDGPDRLVIPLARIENGAYSLSLQGRSIGFIGQARFVKR